MANNSSSASGALKTVLEMLSNYGGISVSPLSIKSRDVLTKNYSLEIVECFHCNKGTSNKFYTTMHFKVNQNHIGFSFYGSLNIHSNSITAKTTLFSSEQGAMDWIKERRESRIKKGYEYAQTWHGSIEQFENLFHKMMCFYFSIIPVGNQSLIMIPLSNELTRFRENLIFNNLPLKRAFTTLINNTSLTKDMLLDLNEYSQRSFK